MSVQRFLSLKRYQWLDFSIFALPIRWLAISAKRFSVNLREMAMTKKIIVSSERDIKTTYIYFK